MATVRTTLRALSVEPRRLRVVRDRPGAWRLAVMTVCVGAFMGQLDASIVTVAIPSITREFRAPVAAVAWVGLAYLVALVASVGAVGRLSDAVGRKLVYLYGFLVFVAASALCAVAPSLWVLVACRAVQGLGAAMLQANSVAIVTLATPKERLPRAIGVQGASQALGLAAGPSLGGLLLALGGWRWLFLVNVPAGLVAFVLGWLLIPRSRELRHRGRVDVVGLALLVPAVAGLLAALTLGPVALGLAGSLALLVAAVGLGAGFVVHERRTASPLLDLALLGSRTVGTGVAGACGSFAVLFGVLLAVPFAAERSLHLGVVATGLVLAVMPVAMGVTAASVGHLADRVGTRALGVAGMLACAAALVAMALAHGGAGALAVELALLGVGLGAFTPANNTAVMRAAPRRQAAEASGLLNMGRGLGTALGLAVASVALGRLGATGGSGALTAIALGLAVVALLVAALTRAGGPRHLGEHGLVVVAE